MKKAQQNSEPLIIEDFRVSIEDKEVVRGLNLEVAPGKVHALMGPNGTGKSSLALAMMGHPNYSDVDGSVRIGDLELLFMTPEDRAKAGLFLAMQYPSEVPGVPVSDFIRTALQFLGKKKTSSLAFRKNLEKEMQEVGLDSSFAHRYLNDGFSGGEKKRAELVQARMLRPRFAIFDEIDSGLDIDALKSVARAINEMRNSGIGVLIITHYSRILDHLSPDWVHIMNQGTIVRSAEGKELALELEKSGYEAIVNQEVSPS